MKKCAGLMIWVLLVCAVYSAPEMLTPEQHRAKYNYTRVQALIDTPMIDCAITRGPGGEYYLTGTTGSRRTEDGGQQSESTKLPPSQGYGEASATKVSRHSTPRNKSGDQAPDTRHPETSPGIKLPTLDTRFYRQRRNQALALDRP